MKKEGKEYHHNNCSQETEDSRKAVIELISIVLSGIIILLVLGILCVYLITV